MCIPITTIDKVVLRKQHYYRLWPFKALFYWVRIKSKLYSTHTYNTVTTVDMTVTYILLIPCCCWSFCDTVYRRGWATPLNQHPVQCPQQHTHTKIWWYYSPLLRAVWLSTSGPVLVILCVRIARNGREVWICVCWCSCFRQRGGLSLSWQPCDRLSCSVLTTVYANILNNTLIRQRGLPFSSASFHVYSQLSFPPVLLLLYPLLSNDL